MLEAAPATGVCVEETPVAVLVRVPEVLLVMVNVTVQLADDGMVRPEKVSAPVWPAVKVLYEAPAQVPPAAPAAETARLVSVSPKVPPVSAMLLGLVRVKVMMLVPPCAIEVVPKALAMVAGCTTTRRAVLETGEVTASVLETPEVVLG